MIDDARQYITSARCQGAQCSDSGAFALLVSGCSVQLRAMQSSSGDAPGMENECASTSSRTDLLECPRTAPVAIVITIECPEVGRIE